MRLSEVTRRAVFSRCGRFRHLLERQWSPQGPRLGFVGLNPSTADGDHDDPTTRRCMGFARAEGFGSLVLVNVFAWRATRPEDLRAAGPPVSASAQRARRRALADCDAVVACWGAVPWAREPARRTLHSILRIQGAVFVLGLSRAGHPRHPLYLPRTAQLRLWADRGPLPAPYGPGPQRDTAELSPRAELL